MKIKDLVNNKSDMYTIADGADEFDKFDVRSAALAQSEKQIEAQYAEELRKQKIAEINEFNEQLTQRVNELVESKDNRMQEIDEVYDEMRGLRNKEDEFLQQSMAKDQDTLRQKVYDELDKALVKLQEKALAQ